MKRTFLRFALITLVVIGMKTTIATAQPFGPLQSRPYQPYPRPQLSPFLDLLRGGNPAANYFLGTIPERQRRQNAQLFGSAIQQLDRQQRQLIDDRQAPINSLYVPLTSTGHPTAFQDYGGYYGVGPGSRVGVPRIGSGYTPPPRTSQRGTGRGRPNR